MPVPCPVPAPPPTPDPNASVGMAVPSSAPGSTCVPVAITIAGIVTVCSTFGGSFFGGCGVTSGCFAAGTVILSLPGASILAGVSDFARRLFRLVAAPAAAAARSGHVQPDDVLAETVGCRRLRQDGPR